MRRPDEDQMTDHIKDKLLGYRPDYNPEAWKSLSSKLDLNTPKKTIFFSKSWITGFITGLLISLGLSYYLISLKTDQNNTKTLMNEINLLHKEINKLKKDKELKDKKLPKVSLKNSILAENKNLKTNHSILPNFIYINSNINTNDAIESANPSYYHDNLSYINTVPVSISASSNFDNNLTPIITDTIFIQDKKTNKNKPHKLKFTWPSLSLKSDGMYKNFVGPNKVSIEYIPSLEMGIQNKTGLSHNTRIGLSGQISNSVSISGGIQIGQYSWSTENTYGHSITTQQDSTFQTVWVEDSIVQNINKWHYIDVPIQFNLKILEQKKSSLEAFAGVNARFFLNERYQRNLTINDNTQSKVQEFSSFDHYNILARMNFGLQYNYHFKDNMSLQIKPYYSTSLQKMSYLQTKNNSWGISVGLVYKFRKDKNTNK